MLTASGGKGSGSDPVTDRRREQRIKSELLRNSCYLHAVTYRAALNPPNHHQHHVYTDFLWESEEEGEEQEEEEEGGGRSRRNESPRHLFYLELHPPSLQQHTRAACERSAGLMFAKLNTTQEDGFKSCSAKGFLTRNSQICSEQMPFYEMITLTC